MATRWYFRATTNDLSGTYPTSEQDPTYSPDFSASGANTLLKLSATKGSSQTSRAANSLAQTTGQTGFYGFWVSPKLAAQSVTPSQAMTVNVANAESSLNMNFGNWLINCYIWRPSTGTKVGTIMQNQFGSGLEPTSASQEQVSICEWSSNSSSLSTADGDVIIIELFARLFQQMGSIYTGTLYYDGTTENTTENAVVSDHASYIEFAQNFTLQAADHTLTGNSAKTQPTSTNGAITQTQTITGNSAKTQPTSTNGAISLGVPKLRVEHLAMRVVNVVDPKLRVEHLAMRVVSAPDPLLRVEHLALRVVSSIIEAVELTGNSARTDNTSTNGAISQTHVLAGNSAKTQPTSTSGAVSQTHALAGNSAKTQPTSSNGAVTLPHVLTGNHSRQNTTSSNGVISQTHVLAGADCRENTTSSAGAISQTHVLAGNSAKTQPTSSSGAISQTHVLAGANVNLPHTCTNGQIGTAGDLLGNNVATKATCSSGAISSVHTLSGNSSRTDHTSTTGAIVLPHVLTGNAANQPITSTTGAIDQTHALAGANANQPNTSSNGDIYLLVITPNPKRQDLVAHLGRSADVANEDRMDEVFWEDRRLNVAQGTSRQTLVMRASERQEDALL